VFVTGVVLLVLSLVMLVLGGRDPLARALGGAAILVSLYVVRISNVTRVPYTTVADIEGETQSANIEEPVTHRAPFTSFDDLLVDPRSKKRIARIRWAIFSALLLLTVISIVCLNRDMAHGGDEVWPVYAFVGFVMVFGLYCYYLATQNFWS
jgi:hypothetical protein